MPKKKRDENKIFADIDRLIQSREDARKETIRPPINKAVPFDVSMIKDDDKPVLDDTVRNDTVRRDTEQKNEVVEVERKPTRISSAVTDDLKEELIRGERDKSDLANTCELLLNEKWRKRKTRLRQRQVSALSTLETLADLYDVKWLREWIDSYTEYLTSEEGRGRQDIVDIAKYTIDKETDMRRELYEALGRR